MNNLRFTAMVVVLWLAFFMLFQLINPANSPTNKEQQKQSRIEAVKAMQPGGYGDIEIRLVYPENVDSILEEAIAKGMVTVRDRESGAFLWLQPDMTLKIADNLNYKRFVPTRIRQSQYLSKLDNRFEHLAIWWPYEIWDNLKKVVVEKQGNEGVFAADFVNGESIFHLQTLAYNGETLKFTPTFVKG
tara:strand:- start:76 stop:639 length:564 start_codon:yes stop_codon:yes gene_type:complete